MQLNSVVLPAPLGPMRPTISPASMASETSRFAARPPKRLVEASTRSRGAMRYAVAGRGRNQRDHGSESRPVGRNAEMTMMMRPYTIRSLPRAESGPEPIIVHVTGETGNGKWEVIYGGHSG